MVAKLVRQTAYELAGAFFDNADIMESGARVRSAKFRAACKNQEEFIALYWASFVPMARKVLAHQLGLKSTSEADKAIIFDALLEDRGFVSDAKAAAPSIIQLH